MKRSETECKFLHGYVSTTAGINPKKNHPMTVSTDYRSGCVSKRSEFGQGDTLNGLRTLPLKGKKRIEIDVTSVTLSQ
jgi:hypothetical protein